VNQPAELSPAIEYRECLVGFYDVLGFSEFVAEHPDASDVHELFARITDLSKISSYEAFGRQSIHFSDVVIRTAPLRDEQGDPNQFGVLFHELIDVVHFQMELIWRESVWLRGSITCGPVYHKGTEVYGPAVVRGYELERDVAVFPRVIIDPDVVALFRTSRALHSFHNDPASEEEHCLNLLRRAGDGFWFVDYLTAADAEADEPSMYPEYLRKHKCMILRKLATDTVVSRRTHKYLWLATYHNEIVGALRDDYLAQFGTSREALQITSEDAPLYRSFRT
jgi:hypothetical protein